MWEPTFLDRSLMLGGAGGEVVKNGKRTSLGNGGSRLAPSSATNLLDSLCQVVAASVSPSVAGRVGMVCEVPSSPDEPGFQATENSFRLSIPFPPISQSCFWCSHCLVMPLGTVTVVGYIFFPSILQTSQKKKKKIYPHHPLLRGFLNHQKVTPNIPSASLLQRCSK